MAETHTEPALPARIHLIGIGGAGLSAIARVLLDRGVVVTGSDMSDAPQLDGLRRAGATVYVGHAAAQLGAAQLVVISSAIPDHNPEVVAARAAGVPVVKRAAFVGRLMADRHGIAVAGTHGKTTTTGMIAHVLLACGADPSFIIGGNLPALGLNGRAGEGPDFVVEADEYDHMFLGLRPKTAIVTNIEHDHPDIYPTWSDYTAAFDAFVDRLEPGGCLIGCIDDGPTAALLARHGARRTVGVGLAAAADWRATDLRRGAAGGTTFTLRRVDQPAIDVPLAVAGAHNVRNALAALAACAAAGVPAEAATATLATFTGMGRRFEIIGRAAGVTVVDDYAHHPTEIEATLAAAAGRYPGARVWAVWQPHTYSRTKLLLEGFATAFAAADRVLVLDIYASRERDTLGLDGAAVAARLAHPAAEHGGAIDATVRALVDAVAPGDVVITLSAGDGNDVGKRLLRRLAAREAIDEHDER